MKKIKQFIKWMTVWTESEKREARVLSIILMIVVVVGGWFYWYQFRPSTIRSSCATIAKDKMDKKLDNRKFNKWGDVDTYYDLQFKMCIEKGGLK